MSKPYKNIFFDLDHTLWDFEKNSHETLTDLFYRYECNKYSDGSANDFVDIFKRINKDLWRQYESGFITKEFLREERFRLSLREFGLPDSQVPKGIWQSYLNVCPEKTNLLPGALETLEYLHDFYELSIVTNGFQETQLRKLQNSGLSQFFSHVVTSERAGKQKPDAAIFLLAVAESGAVANKTLMVGDNMECDILGAKNAGLKQAFFNPQKMPHSESVTHEIVHLVELRQLL